LVCIIVEEQSSIAAFKDFKDDGSVAVKPAAAPSAPTPKPVTAPPLSSQQPTGSASPPPKSSGRVYASPMAKRIAEAKQIRLDVSYLI
jgi:pyruvate dehydrogenase E2 component (dihydrolipoamide acetyltransferase)